MSTRFYIEENKPLACCEELGWEVIDTRPLYSLASAKKFVEILRESPFGGWADRRVRIVAQGTVFYP